MFHVEQLKNQIQLVKKKANAQKRWPFYFDEG